MREKGQKNKLFDRLKNAFRKHKHAVFLSSEWEKLEKLENHISECKQTDYWQKTIRATIQSLENKDRVIFIYTFFSNYVYQLTSPIHPFFNSLIRPENLLLHNCVVQLKMYVRQLCELPDNSFVTR